MRALDPFGLLVVHVLGIHLALPLQAVREIVPVPLLTQPPGAAPFLAGFFDYRGKPVPVLRLDRLLGRPEERLGLYAPLVILGTSDLPLALHVARTETVVRDAPTGAIQPIEAHETLNGCLTGRLTLHNRTVYLLSTERLLLAKERATLLAQQDLVARRLACLQEAGGEANGEASHVA